MKNKCCVFSSFWEWPFYTCFTVHRSVSYVDLVYKFKRIIGKHYFSHQFTRIIIRYERERAGWLPVVLWLLVFLVSSSQCLGIVCSVIVVALRHTHLLKWTKGQLYFEFGIWFTNRNIVRISTKPHRASYKATLSRCPLRPFFNGPNVLSSLFDVDFVVCKLAPGFVV